MGLKTSSAFSTELCGILFLVYKAFRTDRFLQEIFVKVSYQNSFHLGAAGSSINDVTLLMF